jgi:probable phosphoglycerate mutase
MRMIIIRHGESEWNLISRYQGQCDAALSELGQRQAEALAQRLANEPLDAIYTSPLQRASHTARAIAQFHPEVPLSTDDALMEIHHGEWQGKYASEVEEQFSAGLREWREQPMRSQMPGGESFSNVLKRTLEFQERVYAKHQAETIAVSTHDVVIKMLVADVLGMDMNRINRIWISNATISIIEYQAVDRGYLVSLGDGSHLGAFATDRTTQKAL